MSKSFYISDQKQHLVEMNIPEVSASYCVTVQQGSEWKSDRHFSENQQKSRSPDLGKTARKPRSVALDQMRMLIMLMNVFFSKFYFSATASGEWCSLYESYLLISLTILSECFKFFFKVVEILIPKYFSYFSHTTCEIWRLKHVLFWKYEWKCAYKWLP